MAGGGTIPNGEMGLPWHRPHGGRVEGSGENSKTMAHSLRHLPRIPPWIPGRLKHRYRHPRGQTASSVSSLEGGGPVHNIYGSVQDVLCLGQGNMSGSPGGIWRGYSSFPDPPDVLGFAADGCKSGRILQVGITGLWGATHGYPMSLTIFNVVVDVMVRHWVEVMIEGLGGQSRSNQEGRHQNALLYPDDGMLALSDPGCLQGAFSTLVGMFDRVGLNMNVRKTVRIFCCPYQVAGTQS